MVILTPELHAMIFKVIFTAQNAGIAPMSMVLYPDNENGLQ
jgi:hypothetical protein